MGLLARFRALLAAVALAKVDDHRPLPVRLRRLRGLRFGEVDRGKPYSDRGPADATKRREHLSACQQVSHATSLFLRAT